MEPVRVVTALAEPVVVEPMQDVWWQPDGSSVAGAPPVNDRAPRRPVITQAVLITVAVAASLAWSRMFELDRAVAACMVAAVVSGAVSIACRRVPSAISSVVSSVTFVVFAACVAVPIEGVGVPTPSALLSVLRWLPTMVRTTLDLNLPSDAQGQPLLLALFATWLATAIGSELAARTMARAGALVWPVGLFVIALLLGSPLPTRPLALTLPVSVTAMAFLAMSGRDVRGGLQRSPTPPEAPRGARGLSSLAGQGYALLAVVVAAAATVGSAVPWADGEAPSLHHAPPFEPARFISPLLTVSTQASRAEPDDLLTVRVLSGRAGDRIALAALDHYNGDSWESRRRFGPVGQYAPEDQLDADLRTTTTAQVEISGLRGPWVPHSGRVRRLALRSMQSDGPADNYVLPDGLDGDVAYELEFATIEDREAAAAVAPTGAPDRAWLQLPDEPPRGNASVGGQALETCRVGDLSAKAREWTEQLQLSGRPAADQLAQATAIEGHLRNDFGVASGATPYGPGHSLADLCRVVGVGPAASPTSAGSEQFAAAMAVMARSIGIPARVVVGYRLGEPTDDVITVTENDAIAWVQVAIGGAGWLDFDPTPSASKDDQDSTSTITPQRPTPPPPTAPPTTSPTTSSTTTTIAPEDQAAAPTSGGGWTGVEVAVSGSLVLSVVMVAVLLAVTGAKARRRNERQGGRRTNDVVVGAWLEAIDLLRDRGFVPPPNMTARELAVAASAGLAVPDLHVPLVRLARMFADARYSRRTLDRGDAERSWEIVGEIEERLSAAGGRRTRLLARLSPASLRRSGW